MDRTIRNAWAQHFCNVKYHLTNSWISTTPLIGLIQSCFTICSLKLQLTKEKTDWYAYAGLFILWDMRFFSDILFIRNYTNFSKFFRVLSILPFQHILWYFYLKNNNLSGNWYKCKTVLKHRRRAKPAANRDVVLCRNIAATALILQGIYGFSHLSGSVRKRVFEPAISCATRLKTQICRNLRFGF